MPFVNACIRLWVNPQANAICECMHQAVGNSLCAMSTMHPPNGIESANHLVDTALADCFLHLML